MTMTTKTNATRANDTGKAAEKVQSATKARRGVKPRPHGQAHAALYSAFLDVVRAIPGTDPDTVRYIEREMTKLGDLALALVSEAEEEGADAQTVARLSAAIRSHCFTADDRGDEEEDEADEADDGDDEPLDDSADDRDGRRARCRIAPIGSRPAPTGTGCQRAV